MFEHQLDCIRCDADAGIFDDQINPAVGVGFGQELAAYDDFALAGEFDGVVDQVGQYLAQPERIAAHQQRNVRRRQLGDQFESLAFSLLGEHGGGFLDQFTQVELDIFQFHVPGFDLGEVQDVVDDAEQMPAGLQHGIGIALLGGIQGGAEQQFGHAQHPVHGGADFVAHGGEKFALGLAGGLGLLFRRFQFPGACVHQIFQIAPVLAQAFVAGMNFGQHVVETVDQIADFILAGAVDAQVEALGLGDAAGGLRQIQDRLADAPLQAQRQHHRQQKHDQTGAQRGGDVLPNLRPHAGQVDDHG